MKATLKKIGEGTSIIFSGSVRANDENYVALMHLT